MERANKGWDYYIRDLEVVEHSATSARGKFDRDWADVIVREYPNKSAYVPPPQYRSTD